MATTRTPIPHENNGGVIQATAHDSEPTYGPLIDSDPDTDLAVTGQGPTVSVSGMNVIGAGTFKEN